MGAAEIEAVRGLLDAASIADGHAPLDEHAWLDLVQGGREGFAGLVAWEAGHDGRGILDRICAEAHNHLNPGGVMLLVHSEVCGERATLDALTKTGLRAEVVFRHDGTLGPLMRERAAWLAERGLLRDPEGRSEEMLVFKAERPAEPLSLSAATRQEPASRLRSCSLPCSPPLRLSFWARRKKSASS